MNTPKFAASTGGHPKEKKGEASQEQPPLLNEPVGGRLIRVLYCLWRKKAFHFFLRRAVEEKAKI
jgi:hypothetical protein